MARTNRHAAIGFETAVAALLLTATVFAQPKAGNREAPGDAFTAFPEITVPREVIERNGRKATRPDFKKLFSRFTTGQPRPILKDAAPLAKIRTAQVHASAGYLRGIEPRFGLTESEADDLLEMIHTSNDLFRVAVAAEPTAAGKQGLFEDRVALFKESERFTEAKVNTGARPPHRLNLARFYRLQAEAELLVLQQSQKAGK